VGGNENPAITHQGSCSHAIPAFLTQANPLFFSHSISTMKTKEIISAVVTTWIAFGLAPAHSLVAGLVEDITSNWVQFGGIEDFDGDRPGISGWSELKYYKDKVTRDPKTKEVKIEDIKIKKCVDKATVDIASKFAKDEVIDEVRLEFEKVPKDSTDGKPVVYFTIVYCDVTITAIETEKPEGEGEKLEETICARADSKKITDDAGKMTKIGGEDSGGKGKAGGSGGNGMNGGTP